MSPDDTIDIEGITGVAMVGAGAFEDSNISLGTLELLFDEGVQGGGGHAQHSRPPPPPSSPPPAKRARVEAPQPAAVEATQVPVAQAAPVAVVAEPVAASAVEVRPVNNPRKRKNLKTVQVFGRYRTRCMPAARRAAPMVVAHCPKHGARSDAQTTMHAGRPACVDCLQVGDAQRESLLAALVAELDACHQVLSHAPTILELRAYPLVMDATMSPSTNEVFEIAKNQRKLRPIEARDCWKGDRDVHEDMAQGLASGLATIIVRVVNEQAQAGRPIVSIVEAARNWVAPDGDLRSPNVECRRSTRLLQLGTVGRDSPNPIIAAMQRFLSNSGPYGKAMSRLNREPQVMDSTPSEIRPPPLAEWIRGEAKAMREQNEELRAAMEADGVLPENASLALMQGERAAKQIERYAAEVDAGLDRQMAATGKAPAHGTII